MMTNEEQFEIFWHSYPRRISKGAARTAFAKAIKKTTLEVMLEAIEAYKANKPDYQDFKHPSTWLNKECWCDEWTLPQGAIVTDRKRTLRDAREDLGRYFSHADGLGDTSKH